MARWRSEETRKARRWRPRTAGLRIAVALCTAVAAVALTGGAAAADATSGWINFQSPGSELTFSESSILLVQGTRDSNGDCSGTFVLTRLADGKPVGAVEVAANPSTCQQKVRVGKLASVPSSTSTASGNSSAKSSAIPTVVGPVPSPGAMAQATTSTRGGFFQTMWQDPLNFIVNRVGDAIQWQYNGTNVTAVLQAYDNRVWLSADGWSETGHRGPYESLYWNEVTLTTYDTFSNNAFCVGQNTSTQYQPNVYYGYGSGTDYGTISTWASGSCSFLLHWSSYLA